MEKMTLGLGKKRGFTLIESLSVIAIIGILVTLSVYVISQAQRQARDAKRKSDISAIAQGFEARFLDKTCKNQSAVGLYPGRDFVQTDVRMIWRPVSDLQTGSIDQCNDFSLYLPTIPEDPQPSLSDYFFNLSSGAGLEAKHYRLAARLEREPSADQWAEICRLSEVWYNNFLGQRYDGCPGDIFGSSRGILLAARVNEIPVLEVCRDLLDNDGDLLVDFPNDPGCTSPTDTDESNINEDPPPGGNEDPPPGGEEEDIPLPYNYYFGR